MLSKTVEYALRALVVLAQEQARSMTAAQIAQKSDIPLSYLRKIMQQLGKGGLVKSQRGREGGFTLAITPQRLTILAIIDVMDPIRPVEHCPLRKSSQGHKSLCPLHKMLRKIAVEVRTEFETIYLGDLIQPTK